MLLADGAGWHPPCAKAQDQHRPAEYEIVIGSENGPRMGGFIALYGLAQSRALIADALSTKS